MVHASQLDNGVTVVAETVPGAASVGLGVWLRCGARHETNVDNGIAHFLEHMTFKGSAKRDAQAIARDIEHLGGQLDAYTTHEGTYWTFHVLPEAVERAVALLAEMIAEPTLADEAIETEKQVIGQEIVESDDTPADVVQELCAKQAWRDHPLGRPVLGTADTVGCLGRDLLARHHAAYYSAERAVVAAAGAVEPGALTDLVADGFGRLGHDGGVPDAPGPEFASGVAAQRLDIDQVHVCLAAPAVSLLDPDRYAVWLLDAILGSTMSSRLFQEVRERRGLAYHVTSAWQGQRDVGLWTVEAVTKPSSAKEVLRVVRGELDRLVADGVAEEELAWAKEYSRTMISLGSEIVPSRLARLGRSWFYHGRHVPVAEVLQQVARVELSDLHRIAARVFGQEQYVLSLCGAVTEKRIESWWKAVQS